MFFTKTSLKSVCLKTNRGFTNGPQRRLDWALPFLLSGVHSKTLRGQRADNMWSGVVSRLHSQTSAYGRGLAATTSSKRLAIHFCSE